MFRADDRSETIFFIKRNKYSLATEFLNGREQLQIRGLREGVGRRLKTVLKEDNLNPYRPIERAHPLLRRLFRTQNQLLRGEVVHVRTIA